MRKLFFISLLIASVLFTGCTGEQKRGIKSIKSNWTGGLKRVVTLYDYNGKVVQRWQGNIDMSDSEKETDFILNGNKRVVIHGGITVIEEIDSKPEPVDRTNEREVERANEEDAKKQY